MSVDINSLRSKWSTIVDHLLEGMRRFESTVREHEPGIVVWTTNSPVTTDIFDIQLLFMWDPLVQEVEEVSVRLRCSPAKSFRDSDGVPWFEDAEERYAIRLALQKGNAEDLPSLEPMLLPDRVESAELEPLLMDYLQRSLDHLAETRELVLHVIRQREQLLAARES
jgi:hypothetical protein